MTNKQKALLRVVGVFGVATAVPLVVIGGFTLLGNYFTVTQIAEGIACICLTYVAFSLGRLLYNFELSKLDAIDRLNGKQ